MNEEERQRIERGSSATLVNKILGSVMALVVVLVIVMILVVAV